MMINFHSGAIISINKPYGITSFKALANVRAIIQRRLGVKRLKVGHAGTLDPLATGVLILCTGKATKRIESFQHGKKEYVTTLQLGATTESYDRECAVNATFPTEQITKELISVTLGKYKGDILQTPPEYSACKIGGVRAYKLQREGGKIELKPKPIHIDEIEMIDFDKENMRLKLRILCGKGTYIRALARDIGRDLFSGAYLLDLCRTRSGEYTLENSIELEHFQEWLDKQDIDEEKES